MTSGPYSDRENSIASISQTPSSPIEVPDPKSRASARTIAQTSRLLQDSMGEIEYVKGHGIRRVDEDVELEVELPLLNVEEDGIAEGESQFEHNTPHENEDYFRVRSVVVNVAGGKAIDPNAGLDLAWKPLAKKLFVRRNGTEIITIVAKDIISVAYTDDEQRLYIELRPKGPEDCFCPDVHLTMSCDAHDFTILKHILISQVGGMRVNRRDSKFPKPGIRNTSQLVALQRKIQDQEVQQSRSVSAMKATPKPTKREKADKEIGEVMPPKEVGKDHYRSIPDSPTSNVLTDHAPERLSPKVSALTNAPNRLFYKSGKPVEKDELVVRLRAKDEIRGRDNKQDELDIFDGPWQIAEIPSVKSAFSVVVPLTGFNETGHGNDETMDETGNANNQYFLFPKRMAGQIGLRLIPHLRVAQEEDHDPVVAGNLAASNRTQTLVKLHFPQGSTANPWTKLSRLIPVHEINEREIGPPHGSDSHRGSQVVGASSLFQ
ncbi:MAG: hypothetical protein M1830_003775, partial [Pleopsidium flavum]